MNAKQYFSEPQTLLLVRPFAHEDGKSITGRLQHEATLLGLKPPFRVIHTLPRSSPRGTVIVTDALYRLTGSVQTTLRWLVEANETGVALVIPGVLDLRPVVHIVQTPMTVIAALHGIGKQARSARIKEAIFLRKQRGMSVGRKKIQDEVRQVILEQFEITRSIRGTARALRSKGLAGCSRASVARIVRNKVGGK